MASMEIARRPARLPTVKRSRVHAGLDSILLPLARKAMRTLFFRSSMMRW